ncbi:MAG: hypothetical protein CL920_06935 [Deltaproteobacteria bacterium]|nr:hypothetical protein [Deltaproteobacteria bacterium]
MSDSSRTKENTLPSYSSGYMISEEDLAYRWGEVEALSEVDPQLALDKLNALAALIGETQEVLFWRVLLARMSAQESLQDSEQKEWMRGLGRVKAFAEHEPMRAFAELEELTVRFGEIPEILDWRDRLTRHKELFAQAGSPGLGIVPTGEHIFSEELLPPPSPDRITNMPDRTLIEQEQPTFDEGDFEVVSRVIDKWRGESPIRFTQERAASFASEIELHEPPPSYKHRNAMIFLKALPDIIPGTPPGEIRAGKGELRAVKESDLEEVPEGPDFRRYAFIMMGVMSVLLFWLWLDTKSAHKAPAPPSPPKRVLAKVAPSTPDTTPKPVLLASSKKQEPTPEPSQEPQQEMVSVRDSGAPEVAEKSPTEQVFEYRQLIPSKKEIASKTHGFLHVYSQKPVLIQLDQDLTKIQVPTYRPIRLPAGSHTITFETQERDVEKQIHIVAGQLHYLEIFPE